MQGDGANGGPDDAANDRPGDPANETATADPAVPASRRSRRSVREPVPVWPLALDAELDPPVEERLAALVLLAQSGSAAARNEIYALLRVKIGRWVEREWWAIQDRTSTVEPGDVHGEAFLVLAELIDQWPGAGGFGSYVMRVFPWRLRAAVRAQAGLPARLRQSSSQGGWHGPVTDPGDAAETTFAGLRAEESWLAEQAITLLETLSASLDEMDRLMLVWRVRDGQTMTTIARRLGLNRRTAHRHWERITAWIRTEWAA